MSKPKFTPGPWTAVRHGEDIYTWTIRGNDSIKDRSLAVVGVGAIDFERDMANMHLIAAAPELYRFLKMATEEACSACAMMMVDPASYDFIKNGCPFADQNELCEYRDCIAILRKACGESEVEA